MFLIYLWGGFGGGDVKLMAADGALKGYPFVVYAAFYSAIVGGIYSLAVIIWKGRFLQTMSNIGRQFLAFFSWRSAHAQPLNPSESTAIPFGFCICMGTLWAALEKVLHRSLWQWLAG
jgi:prepilin peptidase CpaA